MHFSNLAGENKVRDFSRILEEFSIPFCILLDSSNRKPGVQEDKVRFCYAFKDLDECIVDTQRDNKKKLELAINILQKSEYSEGKLEFYFYTDAWKSFKEMAGFIIKCHDSKKHE